MTGANFVEVINSTVSGSGILNGSSVLTGNFIEALNPNAALNAVNSAAQPGQTSRPAVPLDRVVFDAALTVVPPPVGVQFSALGQFVGGYAKNGCTLITLTTTTAVDVDLTNLATGTTSQVGDATFATVNALVLNNIGATDLTIKPGGSNPANFPKFAGTTPTLTIPAGSAIGLQNVAGATVDSTHKIFTITPTAGGLIAITVMGA